jgi:hypothetical protein
LQEDATQSDRFAVATEQMRVVPEQLWDKQMPPGSIELNNPFAQQFRATKVAVPQPFSLPGAEYWQVRRNIEKDLVQQQNCSRARAPRQHYPHEQCDC